MASGDSFVGSSAAIWLVRSSQLEASNYSKAILGVKSSQLKLISRNFFISPYLIF